MAGSFYPGNPKALISEVDGYLATGKVPLKPALAAISPHAGYTYSGPVAGEVFSQIEVPRRVIILGPQHRRARARAAVAPPGTWRFPFGEVPIDDELCGAIIAECKMEQDPLAHLDEHSLEVQVPFLWRRNPEMILTPIALGMTTAEQLRDIGQGLARAIEKINESVLLVASTDMSHYISEDHARRLDHMAIARILELDPDGLYSTVADNRISMCGVMPTTAVLHAAKQLGATEGRLVRYATSGDVTMDRTQVVGYAGLIIE